MRDRIFSAALDLFGARGYAGASMRELARRCETPVSNVYNYFPSKQALLREVFREGAAQIRATIAAGRGETADLEAYLRSVLVTLRANLDLWRLIQQLRHDETVRALLDEDFTTLLEAATGDLRTYTSEPWMLLALVDGIGSSLLQGLPLPDDDTVVTTVARAVRAVEPSPPHS